mmetsp:Transcript_33737/g.57321  ORF Transcript_33737/g.57321 Transcript_33737/m.57321 type:complete len:276 (-) Transcript_33737:160-987(-)
MDDDKLAELAQEGDEGPKDTREIPKHNPSDNEDDGNSDLDTTTINHQHLFSESKGGAKIAKGDPEFHDEMGAESQNFEAATKIACENIESGDDDDSVEEYDDHNDDQNKSTGFNSSMNRALNNIEEDDIDDSNVGLPSVTKSSKNYRSRGMADDRSNGFNDGFPSPVNSSADNVKRVTVDGKAANNNEDDNGDPWEKLSPDRSTADQSTGSFEGLRTQPTTQQPSPKPKAPPRVKKRAAAKFTIMGTVFENQKKKGEQPAKKKTGGLYIPKYSKK